MSYPLVPLEIPALREHEFQSHAPVIGPVITQIRRVLYSLTAKWPLRVALEQQTRINQQLVQRLYQHEVMLREYEAQLRDHEAQLRDHETQLRKYEAQLHEYDARLIDQDRDLANFSRITAEVELRQRHLDKSQTPS